MAYATSTDLNGVLGYTPANAQVLLVRASRDIDRALESATYDVDTSGNPTDAVVTVALKDATCEQVAYNLEVGNANGIPHGLQSGVPSGTSAGAVELSRGPSTGGATVDQPWLAEQASIILRQTQGITWGVIPV